MQKVFRVLIGEQQGFHVDVAADSAEQAMQLVKSKLEDPTVSFEPIEDNNRYSGYVVEEAEEISRENADLE